jgi:flagellar motor protein MotB
LVKNGQLERETVEQLLKICQAKVDKRPELLFLTLKPMHYLIRPSVHMGPDMIGFLDFNGEPVLFTVSMSIYSSANQEKFDKNKAKTAPAEFYHYLKTVTIKPTADKASSTSVSNTNKGKDTQTKQDSKATVKKIKEPSVYKVASALPPLPSKTLRISITIPSAQTTPEEGTLQNDFLVYINQDNLKSLGLNFARLIEDISEKKDSKKTK